MRRQRTLVKESQFKCFQKKKTKKKVINFLSFHKVINRGTQFKLLKYSIFVEMSNANDNR